MSEVVARLSETPGPAAGSPGPDTYTAESLSQLALLESCAAQAQGSPLRVLLRLTSGNQFGMDEETILSIIQRRNAYPPSAFYRTPVLLRNPEKAIRQDP